MEPLSFDEFVDFLKQVDYCIEPDELRELINRVLKPRCVILTQLQKLLSSKFYNATIVDDTILDIYLDFCGLQFSINEKHHLIVVEEMWYNRGCCTKKLNLTVGEPTVENVIKIIQLFEKRGKGTEENKSLSDLLNEIN